MIGGDHTVISELLQRFEAAAPGIDCKTSLRQRVNHQILLDAGLSDARKKLGIVAGARGDFADVERPRLQLVERDHPDVGGALRCGRSGLVPLTFRSLNLFMQPFVRRPRGFCHPAMSDGGVDYRNH